MPDMLAIATRLGIDITGNSPHSFVVPNVVSTINAIIVNAIVVILIPVSILTSATDTAEVSTIFEVVVVGTSIKIPSSVVIIIIVTIIIIIIIFIIIIVTIFSFILFSITTITTFSISSIITINKTLYTIDIAWLADGPGLGTDSAN
jgi:hypothetical protein